MLKDRKILIILLLAVAMAAVYCWPYFSLRPDTGQGEMWIFNTPDEMANYFFISNLVSSGELKASEPLNSIGGSLNIVHPRSMQAAGGYLVPGSFIGFILVEGWLAKIFGLWLIPFLIPLFSVLASLCFYLLLKKIFRERIAFWSTLLLLFLPAWWYYNSRSLFNNILFLDFLIVGFFLIFLFFDKKKIIWLICGGLLIGWALTMRTSDAVWVGLLLGACLWFNRKKISWLHWLLLAALVALPFLPVLFYQRQLYGGAWETGYNLKPAAGGSPWLFTMAKKFLLPFGFNIKNIVYNSYFYFVKMFWWYFGPGLLGGILLACHWWKQKLTEAEKRYFILFILVSLFISVYYGSWFFFNNLMGKPLIGSSQTRYLLPIYILSLPLVVYGFDWVISRLRGKFFQKIVGIVMMTAMLTLSVQAVWFGDEEGLSSVIKTVRSYQQIQKEVTSLTEANSIIVTSYNDKVFFPKRRIVYYWLEPQFLTSIGLFLKEVPVYLYSVNNKVDEDYVRGNSSLKMELVRQINASEALYKLTN